MANPLLSKLLTGNFPIKIGEKNVKVELGESQPMAS